MTFQQVVQSELSKLKADGLRLAVVDLCEVLGIALTPAQREHLARLDLGGLEVLRAHLEQHRAWPA